MRRDPRTAVMDRAVGCIEEAQPAAGLSSGGAPACSRGLDPVPDRTHMTACLQQAAALMTRVAMTGTALKSRGVDTTSIDVLVADTRTQIALARGLLSAGDGAAAAMELSLARETMVALRDTFCAFLAYSDLPPGMGAGAISTAESLDKAVSLMDF